ncbi:MAG TPA: hypothetical protein VF103_14570 [Polyangiaceae bacterium]
MGEGAGPERPRGGPVRPAPATNELRSRFTRGKEKPRGVVWFGITSFWGHLQHFIATAIATEDVDSRDWMTPDDPRELLAQVARELGGNPEAPSLLDALGRDVFIDFIADTGDDAAVSRAVARLLFAEYELPDPDRPGEHLVAPRGEILLFGGDTAYPVATTREIANRVVAPWNQVLDELPKDGKPRVLLGIPGNHDWYDGLDGFQRLFRRRSNEDEVRASIAGISQAMLEHYAEWTRQFYRGGKVKKPQALALAGYTPVQNASYFAFPISRAVHLYAVDRQLTTIDPRQSRFLGDLYREQSASAAWVLLPDPVYHFGNPSKTGTAMVEALQLDFEAREHFVLTGDVHHYERLRRGRLLHVIAGGGGAFLHPARLAPGGLPHEVKWPSAAQSRRLLRHVPLKIGLGRSGFLPHIVLLLLFAPGISFGIQFYERLGVILSAPFATTFVLTVLLALIGGVRRRPKVLPLAFLAALVTALLPIVSSYAIGHAFENIGLTLPFAAVLVGTLIATVFLGVFVFGAYLAVLTGLGFEHTQAFTALDHPGFKHFLRLRVRADGSGIDGWCIGLADPLGPGQTAVLVDTFEWRPK